MKFRIVSWPVLLAMLGCLAAVQAQDRSWIDVPAHQAAVRVEMPGDPLFRKETVLVGGDWSNKDVYSLKTAALDLYFEVTPLPAGMSSRDRNREPGRALERLAMKFGGSLAQEEKLEKNDVTYQYAAMGIPSGELVRQVAFVYGESLHHLYVIGTTSSVFGLDANYYLQSWKTAVTAHAEETAVETPVPQQPEPVEAETMPVYNDTWIKVDLDSTLQAAFPAAPFRKTTVVHFGTRHFGVTSWSRNHDKSRLNFVITQRVYGTGEGQLDNEALYDFVRDRLVDLKRLKVHQEQRVRRPGIDSREIVFSKGLRFYRVQVFRRGDTLYQALVKGGRKSIYKPEAERFFGGIKPAN